MQAARYDFSFFFSDVQAIHFILTDGNSFATGHSNPGYKGRYQRLVMAFRDNPSGNGSESDLVRMLGESNYTGSQ